MGLDELTSEEIGEFLEKLGRTIKDKSTIRIQELKDFVENIQHKGGVVEPDYQGSLLRDLDEATNLLRRFRTVEEMREFLQMLHETPIPHRLSRSTLFKLGIGILVTSNVNLDEALARWRRREEALTNVHIYDMSQDQLVSFFRDRELFPDGYSILSFARRFNIKLPYSNDKKALISILVDYLHRRPSDSKRIGRWGLGKEGKE